MYATHARCATANRCAPSPWVPARSRTGGWTRVWTGASIPRSIPSWTRSSTPSSRRVWTPSLRQTSKQNSKQSSRPARRRRPAAVPPWPCRPLPAPPPASPSRPRRPRRTPPGRAGRVRAAEAGPRLPGGGARVDPRAPGRARARAGAGRRRDAREGGAYDGVRRAAGMPLRAVAAAADAVPVRHRRSDRRRRGLGPALPLSPGGVSPDARAPNGLGPECRVPA